MPDKKLVVIGDGPELPKLQRLAGPNVKVMGWQANEVMRDHLQRAKAFVFAGEEDFGIILLEAQACGTPVIAYGRGGALETVVENKTGLFFDEQTVESVKAAVAEFETQAWDAQACRTHSERFSAQRFRDSFHDFVEGEWSRFAAGSERAKGSSLNERRSGAGESAGSNGLDTPVAQGLAMAHLQSA